MPYSRRLCAALVLALSAQAAWGQAARPGADPGRARLVTADVETFARAYDLAARETTREAKAAVLRREYLDKGTAGLKDFAALGKIASAERLAQSLEESPRFYAWLREYPRHLARMEPQIRAAFRRMKGLYPEAKFPDVYFLVGHFRSSGTVSDRGLLIGAEVFAAAPETPMDEFPPERRRFVHPMTQLPYNVAHELVHIQQDWEGKETLLEQALVEGGAEFVAELMVPGAPVPTNAAWGDAHERQIWERFRKDMHGTDVRDWVENNDRATPDWPAALAYYVGYKIARAYYERAKDKRKAIRELLRLEDPAAILRASGYAERFAP